MQGELGNVTFRTRWEGCNFEFSNTTLPAKIYINEGVTVFY